jgi:hypothetical protein
VRIIEDFYTMIWDVDARLLILDELKSWVGLASAIFLVGRLRSDSDIDKIFLKTINKYMCCLSTCIK